MASNDTDVYFSVVIQCIEIINEGLPDNLKLPGKPESVLIGENGIYDSLSLINLLVEIETSLKELGHDILLLDEDLISDSDGPFTTVQGLVNYIHKMIQPI